MEFAVLGWPEDDVALRLDYRAFAYAGKFVMTSTGKAVIRDPDDPWSRPEDDIGDPTLVAAVAFNEDRTDASTLCLRYVTVREDRRGEGLGARLAVFVVDRARRRGYDRCRIAVNNPFSYEALYKAGFAYTGRETGLAELVLERELRGTTDSNPLTYRAGFDLFAERDLSDAESAFVAERRDADPPTRVEGFDDSQNAED